MDSLLDIERKRKSDHIAICSTQAVESDPIPFASVRLVPEALPEFNFQDVDTQATLFQKRFSLPLLITGMTGGIDHGQHINEVLALAAQQTRIPMGLGSMKMVLRYPESAKLFDVRKVAPDVFLIGNLGAHAFKYGVNFEDVLRLIERFSLNAFALHLNALQECIQPEGEQNFAEVLKDISAFKKKCPVPLMIKEVGSGLSRRSVQQLLECGVDAIDVGGSGGTSWGYIEGLRGTTLDARLGECFRNWGYSTEESLAECIAVKGNKNSSNQFPHIVATGGMRDGLQMAKAIACGADFVGVGLPLLKAAVSSSQREESLQKVLQEIEFFQRSFKIAMFCSGAKTIMDLPAKRK